MRKKVIAGNWKMNKLQEEANVFVNDVIHRLPEPLENVEVILCAPFPYLSHLAESTAHSPLFIGAQTMHYENSGAYTGEVSPIMLKDIGVTHVILGHSERRQYFGETDETVNKKVKAALTHRLVPIVCVGETLTQREVGETKNHIKRQVKRAITNLTEEEVAQLMIAYEPIWAIGTGKTASSKDANDVCTYIREIIAEETSIKVADEVIIQYGGSVNPDNINELLAEDAIDGALVGGASLEVHSFLKLVEAAQNA